MKLLYKWKQALAIIVTGIGIGLILHQTRPLLYKIPNRLQTPTPTWQEQPLQLTEIETATMSGNFQKEFETRLQEMRQTPLPSPIFTPNIPASMAGDLIPPTGTINGGPLEGSTITQTSVCFPLWVSDNMTPWQQLATRAKLDDLQWSNWMNLFSYCFENLDNGGHIIRIQIRDLAGNVSTETQRLFTIRR